MKDENPEISPQSTSFTNIITLWTNWDALQHLVPFVQFEKREKQPWILLVKLLAKACSNSTYILILPLLNSFNLTESVFPNFQQRPFHGLVCHLHVRKDWQTVYYTVNACSVISSIFHALTLVKIITFWI